MKVKTRVLVILVLAAVLAAAYVPAIGLAKGIKTEFSGTECLVAPLAGGTSKPLGNGAVHTTGLELLYRDETSDPRTTGDAYIVVNMVLDPSTGSGPMWGTIEIVNELGSWSGFWNGRMDNWSFSIRAVAHGSGAYEGLVGYWNYERPGQVPCYGLSGYVVETGAGE